MPARNIKKAETPEETCRRHQEETIQIRKTKRIQNLQKRRAMAKARQAGAAQPNQATTDAPNHSNVVSSSQNNSQGQVATVEQLPHIAANLKKMTPAQRFEATRSVRRLLSRQETPPAKEVIEAGLVPLLVAELGLVNEEKTQFEAAWALTNIASTEHTRVIVAAGAVPYLVKLMMSKNPDIREQCLWCLGNVAGEGHDMRDLVLKVPGGLNNLLMNVKHAATDSLLGNATWTLSNFCRGKPQPPLDMIRPALPYLAKLITHKKLDVVGDACWALSYVSDGDDNRIQACVELNIVPTLINLLKSSKSSVVTPALRTLGNIVSGNDKQTQMVLDANVFDAVKPLLRHSKRNVRKEACWTFSNIAAGTQPQVDSLLQRREILTTIMNLLTTDDYDVRKEAAWVISNICTGGNAKNITTIVGMGGLNCLCTVLDAADVKITSVALEAVEAILRKSGSAQYADMIEDLGGLDKLEDLQEHQNESIYRKSKGIIDTYFAADDDDEEDEQEDAAFGANTGFQCQDVQAFGSSDDKQAADPFGNSTGAFNASQPVAMDWGF